MENLIVITDDKGQDIIINLSNVRRIIEQNKGVDKVTMIVFSESDFLIVPKSFQDIKSQLGL